MHLSSKKAQQVHTLPIIIAPERNKSKDPPLRAFFVGLRGALAKKRDEGMVGMLHLPCGFGRCVGG